MNRRGFIGTILTLSAAPAIARASSLMPVHYRVVAPWWANEFSIQYCVHPATRLFSDIRLTRGFAGPGARSITPFSAKGQELTGGWAYVRTDYAGLSLLPRDLRLELPNIV